MRIRTILILSSLSLACLAGRAQAAGESVKKVDTPALTMTGMAVTAMRNSRITTPELKMTGMAVTAMRNSKITTPVLQMTGMAVTTMRNSKITTPTLQMTGMAVTAMRNSKITTPALQMTGMAVTAMRNPKITTPTLQMTGMAVTDWSSEDDKHEGAAQSPAGAAEADEIRELGNKFTFSIPVELENMPDQIDRFQVTVSVVYAGAGSRTLIEKAEKDIRGGRFDDSVRISVEPAAGFSGKALSYKANLLICNEGSCVSPLEPGANGWARPELGSSLKASHEGPLADEREIEVPSLSMTGNKKDDQVAQSPSVRKADADDSFRGDADSAQVSPEKYNPKSSVVPEKTGSDELR